MRAAVVGAGPAGFYTAQALLKRFPNSSVDILERLPVPFGLVRYGVAPDHPATKHVTNHFTNLVTNNRHRLNFYGNVPVGPTHPVTPQLLNQCYDLTIFATGAARPRTLDIPLPSRRVHSANDFVLWLNSHPDAYDVTNGPSVAQRIEADLASATDIAVFGVGNVAIDVARILLRPVDDLRSTDIAPSALDLLSQSRVSSVTLYGRKSPARAAWTTAALREIVTKIPGIVTVCDHDLVRKDLQQPELPRQAVSALKLLAEKTMDCEASRPAETGQNLLHLQFLQSPSKFILQEDSVSTHLSAQTTTDETNRHIDHDTVFLSLGYIAQDCSQRSVGWANGKASGIIGDNKWDAESVVSHLHFPSLAESESGAGGIPEWVFTCADEIVTWEGWLRIDDEERRRAREPDSMFSRVRIQSVPEMLQIAGEAHHGLLSLTGTRQSCRLPV